MQIITHVILSVWNLPETLYQELLMRLRKHHVPPPEPVPDFVPIALAAREKKRQIKETNEQ